MSAPRGEDEPSATSPWRELRAELEAAGVRPTKTLGQNFLFDPNLARAMVKDAGVRPGDRVLEVGPGCGFLTAPLADLGVELVAVDIDERLLAIARRRVGERPNVTWIHADALGGKHALSASVDRALWTEGDWHVVANLPYGISGPLVAILAARDNPPASMTLLVQTEVAERLAAAPGDDAWGALTVRVALRYRARLGREVGAHLFWPRPKVRSRVVRLERRTDDPVREDEWERVYGLVEACFQQRRKALLSSVSTWTGDRERALAALESAGLDPRERPENVSPEAFLALSRASATP